MSKHEVVIHENTGATKEFAPYLGSYIAKETVKETSFALSAATKAGMSPIQFRAVIDGAFQAIEELEQMGLVRIHTDLGVICAIITGSFPTSDAAPNPEKNKLILCLRLADELKLSLADVVPTIIADENLTKLRVDNVMDLETPKPYNLVHGQGIFRVAGYNMVLDDVGSTVYLTDKKGVTYEVVVDEVISKQLFKGHTAALLEAGDYKLVVKSRAGDAEGPLQTAFRKVKYLKVAPPVVKVTKVYMAGHPEKEGVVEPGGANVFEGENLVFGEGDSLTFHEIDLPDTEIACDVTSSSPGKLEFVMNGSAPSSTPIYFTLKTRGGIPGGQLQTVEVEAVSRDYEE